MISSRGLSAAAPPWPWHQFAPVSVVMERSLGGVFRRVYGCLLRRRARTLALKDGDRAGPARRRPLDLDGETRHHEAGRGQKLQIVQLLDMAVADVTAGLVAFPDQAGILGLGIFLRGIDE